MKLGGIEIWHDVMDRGLDDHVAPELGQVAAKDPKVPEIYADAGEFFKRTYFTDSMVDILEKLVETLEGKGKHNIFLIYSLFGGGKTHTVLTVYHAFNSPEAIIDSEVLKGYDTEKREKIKGVARRLKSLGQVKVVSIYGKDQLGSPANPLKIGPYEIRTLWGYMGYLLGRYAEVESYDRTAEIPPGGVISRLLGNGKVVFLIDEIIHYINSLHGSTSEDNRRYSKSVMGFLDSLTTSVLGTNNTLIVTLPMADVGMGIKTEKQYDEDVVRGTWRALTRVGGSDLYSPLRSDGVRDEVVEVLKRRIFKNIDETECSRVLSKIRQAMANREIFGADPYMDDALSRTYPFHPDYVEILKTIIEKTGLQRTRDMLRITRIIVREIISLADGGYTPALIMPYHIDPLNEEIQGLLFAKDSAYAGYFTAANTDLRPQKFSNFSNPDLARYELVYVFLKTYPFDSAVPMEGFPRLENIARGVYEPNLFELKGWNPESIRDAYEEINESTRFVYLNRKEGVSWFWRVANVVQMVDRKTKDLLEESFGKVHSSLVDHVESMVKSKRKPGKRGRGAKIEEDTKAELFSKRFMVVAGEPQDFPDSPDYKLQVLVTESVSEDDLSKIIYRSGTGTRTYRNTVVVCYPVEGSFRALATSAARAMACDSVIKDITNRYGNFGKDVVEIQTHMVKDIQDKAFEDLTEGIVNSFRKVAYPENNDVKTVMAQASSKSVVENVYVSLVGSGKIVEEIDFDSLVKLFQDYAGIEILREEGYRVSEILDTIRTNTKLPMMENNVVIEALKDGVRNLEIGVEQKGKVLFKKVYDERPEISDEKGEVPDSFGKHDIILPPKVALEKQVSELLKEEKEYTTEREGKSLWVKVWYEVFDRPSDTSGVSLKSMVEESETGYSIKPDRFDDILYGYIVRRIQERVVTEGEFEIEIEGTRVEALPGEVVNLEIRVKPLGKDSFDVELSTDLGKVDPATVHLKDGQPAKSVWSLEMPESGMVVALCAEGPKGTLKKEIILVPKSGEDTVETATISPELKGAELKAICGMKSLEDLEALPESLKGTLSGTVEVDSPRWKSEFSGVDFETAKELVSLVVGVLGGKGSVNLTFHADRSVEIDNILFEKFQALNGKVTFVLKRQDK